MSRVMRSPLFLMALTIFIDFTGFGLIIPLLPFWAERLGAGAIGVGLALTTYALAQFIFTPVLGGLSDRYGRRPIILASLLVESIAFALTALATSFPLLLAARFIGGLGASNIGSAQAVVSDITTRENRARGMGAIGAAIGLGFVVGPAMGGILSPLGPALPFWVAMGLALLNGLLVLLFLPETHKNLSERSERAGRSSLTLIFTGWQKAAKYPVVLRLILVNLCFTLAFTAMESVFALFSQRTFGWTASQNGYIFTYVGIIVVIMQGGLVGRLVKRFGERSLMLAGLGLLAIGLGLLPLSSSLALLLVSLGVLSVGEGAVTPTSSTLLSFATPQDSQGELLGLSQGIGGLGRTLGPLGASLLFARAGIGAPFLMGAILCLIALVIGLPRFPEPSHDAPGTREIINETSLEPTAVDRS